MDIRKQFHFLRAVGSGKGRRLEEGRLVGSLSLPQALARPLELRRSVSCPALEGPVGYEGNQVFLILENTCTCSHGLRVNQLLMISSVVILERVFFLLLS